MLNRSSYFIISSHLVLPSFPNLAVQLLNYIHPNKSYLGPALSVAQMLCRLFLNPCSRFPFHSYFFFPPSFSPLGPFIIF